jgi:PBSX family phage terminase large subunit
VQNQETLTVTIDYEPLPTQLKFHLSPKKFRLYRGGLGSGKTKAGCQEAIKQSVETPYNFGVITRATYQELEDSTMRTFFDECPNELIKSFNKQNKHLFLHNGSEIIFRSLDTPEKFRSAEFGWFYIDEASEATEDAFKFLMGRLRRQNTPNLCGFLTTNPVNVTHWLYKWFVMQKLEDFAEFHAPTHENRKHLPENYIESLEKNYPKSWVKKYLNGDWGFTEGGIPCFTNFREDLHVRDLKYLSESPIYVGMDFGFRRPAAIFTQLDQQDRWLILKEYMPENLTVHDFARGILGIQNKAFPLCKQFIYYGDPACRQASDKSEKTSADICRDHGINVYSRKSSPVARVEIIQKRLQTLHGDSPSMLVNRECTYFIDALSGGYRYQDRPDKEEVEKDGLYEHIVDAAGYLSVGLFAQANAKTLRGDGAPRKIGNWGGR